ncbi:MAG: hypothetical protein OSA95_06060, partial [Opitutales bacterium]|nr:hypothetical protein [Opitutales bacterium]
MSTANEAPSPEQLEFFEARIRPVLAQNCYKCHSTKAKKLKAGLYLDRRAGWQHGGENGPVIIPGKPEESRLIIAIRYDNNDLRMPKKGKLPAKVITDFEKWIEMGAPDPRDAPLEKVQISTGPRSKSLEEGRKFWAFKPLGDPPPPRIQQKSHAAKPLDHFILAKLEQKKLQPAAPAEK